VNEQFKYMAANELPPDAALLDIRVAAAFARGHLPGSVSIPLSEFTDAHLQEKLNAIFLPPRHTPLTLVDSDPERMQAALVFLQERGRDNVTGVLLDEAGPGLVPGSSDAHLWRPPEFLTRHADHLPPSDAGPVVDLGAGSGRASVWLATRGFDVTAVDHLPDALDLVRVLAEDRDVQIKTETRDLTDPQQLPAGPWSAALAFRFLDRDLLSALPRVLLPGAIVMVSTFRWDPKAKILPKRRHCLEAGELLVLFPSTKYEILVHTESEDEDGRPSAGVVARLPA
jgi:tellurite methyltransferase